MSRNPGLFSKGLFYLCRTRGTQCKEKRGFAFRCVIDQDADHRHDGANLRAGWGVRLGFGGCRRFDFMLLWVFLNFDFMPVCGFLM